MTTYTQDIVQFANNLQTTYFEDYYCLHVLPYRNVLSERLSPTNFYFNRKIILHVSKQMEQRKTQGNVHVFTSNNLLKIQEFSYLDSD